MHYGMIIDTVRCFGCKACAVACKSANGLPDGIWWNKVMTVGSDSEDAPSGTYPNLTISYQPLACQHCVSPACVAVCPVEATWKDEESGLVLNDAEICIGCKLCLTACPYEARVFIESEPTYYQGFQTGDSDTPPHVALKVEKCTLCKNRLDRNEDPACMHLCPGRARFYGDFDDPNSEVSKLVASREYYRLLEDKGTEPSVYFLT